GSYTQLQIELRQWAPAERVVYQWNLHTPETLGIEGVQFLHHLLGLVVQRFAVEPRWMLQRGRIEDAHKRLDRILAVLDDFDQARQSDQEFKTKLGEWQRRIREAALRKLNKEI